MYENGANIRLPEADEVILCNSSTTTEDVSQSLCLLFVVYHIIMFLCMTLVYCCTVVVTS